MSALDLRYRPPGDLEMTWLIARRAAVEALQDRLSLTMYLGSALILPIVLVATTLRPVPTEQLLSQPATGDLLAVYVLLVGLLPTISAVGIAAGQFAGEKERGILTPLLASPASNTAIFVGKVLGAIIPTLGYSAVAECALALSLAVMLGLTELAPLAAPLSLTMLALVPAIAWFGASTASLISSRVRTFNAAQQISSLVLMPLWGIVFAVTGKLPDWGPLAMIGVAAALVLVDLTLTGLAATTWRREEILAHR